VVYRAGMQAIVRHLESRPVHGARLPTREERDEARLLWRSFLDYQLALESIRAAHSDFLLRSGAARDSAFRLDHAAWLAQYRAALQFIDAAERHPEHHTMLNESDRTLGLVSGSYADFKFHWLNVARAAEYSAFALLDTTLGGRPLPGAADDSAIILKAGAGSGTKQTIVNAGRVVQTALWTPIPQGIQAAGGGPEKPPPRAPYISPAQLAKIRQRLAPGDLVFERREWALTNIGLPGFWPHVAMYVGSPDERRRLFGADFESALRAKNPRAYDATWSASTVIEALGEGVITSTFEHSAYADAVAVVRPGVATEKKAAAIARAFQYVGRPYDFEFDFATDDRIVCTELVYKSYEGSVDLPVMRLAGRSVTPANDYVRWFDERFDRGRDLDFVAFLDGHAHSHKATEASVADLRASWKRPRWHSMTDRQ
ncbi:MAG TPA: YiiX/YebB-like N1pC/P60 family cysteine hydrolase, partial [Thermoanaerobaculia bacterium]